MIDKAIILKEMPEHLYSIFKNNKCILAGGSLTAIYCKYFLEETTKEASVINDFDVYFNNAENIDNVVKELTTLGYKCEYNSENAISFSKENEVKIQLIQLSDCIGPAEDIIKTFDFSVCSIAYDFFEDKVYFDKLFENDIKENKITFNVNTPYPICSLIRSKKYLNKGYTFSSIELLKLALCINNLKIDTFLDLKSQLRGIDTLILAPITDNLINTDSKYDMGTFLDDMSKFLDEVILNEEFKDKKENNKGSTISF